MHPKNFGQRIGLAVSTLMSASAAYLSLLNALPPTGYLTLADRMMIVVYVIFLFKLAASVWIMRLVDGKRIKDAINFNKNAVKDARRPSRSPRNPPAIRLTTPLNGGTVLPIVNFNRHRCII